MADREVAVTGIGFVLPAGHSVAAVWDHIVAGRTAIGPVRTIPTDRLGCALLAEIVDFDGCEHFDRRQLLNLDRMSQFAVVAARRAVADAALDLAREDRDCIPTILGSGVGGLTTLDASFAHFYGPALGRPAPMTIPKSMLNAGASNVSIDLELRGESYAVASACSSSAHAIGHAFRLVRSGAADVAITGGAEACLTVGTIKGWESMRVLSNDGCRPFSADRSGLVLGEGAAILVLEEAGRARARGAHIYGLVAGFGASADACDITAPDAGGAVRAMAAALRDAGIITDDVGYINAHGTGTQANDATEARAIHMLFGEKARSVPVSSTKGALGHSLGATGAVEAALSLLALDRGILPPTAGWRVADPNCELDVIHGAARPAQPRVTLSNSFAFGGLNAALVFRHAPTG